MKKHKETLRLGTGLILLSLLLHGMHYMIFGELHHLLLFLVGDIAFIPLEVFFVSLILERVVERQDNAKKLSKTHMLVQLFYLEAGGDLLELFATADPQLADCRKELNITSTWDEVKFKEMKATVKDYSRTVDMDLIDLNELNHVLMKHKSLLMTLIANPMTLEHEGFSDALMATFHLYDELERRDLDWLTNEDMDHLAFDIRRSYTAIIKEWTHYMEHLSQEYPYLFTTALQVNPFVAS